MNNYLEALSKIIKKQLSQGEYSDVMQYYTEYFEDAGFEKENEVIRELGRPEELANRILEEYRGNQILSNNNKKGFSVRWLVLIAIVGLPLWILLLYVSLVLILAVATLVLSIGIFAIAGILGGVGLILGGIFMLTEDIPLALIVIGYGFLLSAIGCMLMMAIVFLYQVIFKKIKKNKNTEEAA